ncbi:DUF1642 domain-containing protein [Streptococcus pneumoniae]|uniref:DUF1642 domain-containing protein n=1 Tax=Streptococcus pneumoniae TaxID=1313 RepID=UPI0021518DCF|nr:DUF1642 domain-containing protein [Streptococcus pneumoniae]MDG7724053.1 DUF1642 domain-containing protein [Streptococcus pneumoniae]MDG8343717.1 DUF1642 domain-containing protein [Streptococcus pneumoniae]
MNIKALIKKYEELWNEHSPFYEPVPYTSMVELFLKELKQLDEPQKVKVPQFVAEWIEEARKACKDVAELFEFDFTNDEVRKWFMQERPFDLVARAWLDDYDIQKTKYVVTDGNHLYFKNYQEDIEIVILVDEQPGTMDYVKKFDTREGAQKAADILGWKVQEVKDET